MDNKNKEVPEPPWRELLKARMREKQVTNEEMAGHLEVTAGLVSHWFTGYRDPRLSQYIEMCRYVMADPAALLANTALPPVSNSEIVAGQQMIVERLDNLEGKILGSRPETSPTHKKMMKGIRKARRKQEPKPKKPVTKKKMPAAKATLSK